MPTLVEQHSRAAVQSIRTLQELPNLDALRTFAVGLVFFYHLANITTYLVGLPTILYGINWDPIGRAGVLLFFVHTSFVLMQSMDRSHLSVSRFYLRRAFRIYPLSILCVLGVLAFRIPLTLHGAFVRPDGATIAANLLLAQNVIGAPSMTVVLWSLPYEVQMYLILPFLFLVLFARRRVRVLVTLCALAWLGSIGANRIPHGNLFYFAPCFMGGVAGFYVFKRAAALRGRWSPAVGAVALVGLTAAFVAAMDFFKVPTFTQTKTQSLLFGAVCLIVGLLIPLCRQFQNRPSELVFKTIAKYSYGIYLTHSLVMWLCFVKLQAPRVVCWLGFVVLALALPVACFHLVEDPLIRLGKRLTNRRRSAAVASSGFAAVL